MSLQDKLDAMKRTFESGGNLPASVIEAMHRATAELIASGAAARAVEVGDKAPAFVLKDPDGHPVALADLLAQGPLVLTFYRGIWCPYCNADLQALQAALPQLEEYGVKLVAISPQTAPNSRRSQRENKLGFPIRPIRATRLPPPMGFASSCRIISPTFTRTCSKTTSRSSTATRAGRCRCRRVSSSPRTARSSTPRSIQITRAARTRKSCCRRCRSYAPPRNGGKRSSVG